MVKSVNSKHRPANRRDRQLAEVLECCPVPALILEGTRICLLNTVARQAFGSAQREAVGTSIIEHFAPDDRAHVERVVAGDSTGDASFKPDAEQLQLNSRTGERRKVKLSSVRVEYRARRCLVIFAQDVTDRSTLREHLLQADRLASLGTLAAGIAHEINNPLAYLLLNVEYLAQRVPRLKEHPEELDKLVERLDEVRHGGERVAAIVRDLRSFARGGEDLPEAVEIVPCIESAIKLCEHQLRQRASLHRQYAQVSAVRGNGARLEQVFVNLLVNAAHASPEGARQKSRISISVEETMSVVRVTIQDTGSGIAPDVLERVFDPFFTTKSSGEGTGLGLAICRSIVENAGGSIQLASTPGKGTTATVTLLPASTEAAGRVARSHPPMSATTVHGGRVLIVDDDRTVAESLRRHLAVSHDVVIADGGSSALKLLDHDDGFECILCDVVMPEVSGPDVYETLKQRQPELVERMVFMTGGAFTERVADFVTHCERPVLRKPFQLDELSTELHKTILRTRRRMAPPATSGEFSAPGKKPRKGRKRN